MAVRMIEHLMGELPALRVQGTPKRVRAMIGEHTAADTTRALLVWEPKRVVPCYAVPLDDLKVEVTDVDDSNEPPAHDTVYQAGGPPILNWGSFRTHTTDGRELSLRGFGATLPAAAFRADDPDMSGYLILDFDAFDRWLEEDEPLVGHPRDPFHRIDVRRSSRHVRISLDGHVIADTSRPHLLFELPLPPRYYLPAEDVLAGLIGPTGKTTACAYKGIASYFTVQLPDREVPDLAWSYPHPLTDAAEIAGLVSFFNERVDIEVDGQPIDRPRTPWS